VQEYPTEHEAATNWAPATRGGHRLASRHEYIYCFAGNLLDGASERLRRHRPDRLLIDDLPARILLLRERGGADSWFWRAGLDGEAGTMA
jgi:hypothetical protein